MMMESRDPAIKLFGMNIPFPADFDSTVEMMEWSGGDGREVKSEDKVTPEISKRNIYSNNSPKNLHDSKPETGEKEETISTDQIESNDCKTLKKPTKILPCPRCKSMDTKFCYYNNYNINQPRHFCKACQRYWTAGGTMRNVPVGAGRRKNKNSSSHYRHIPISEALEAARLDSDLQASTRVLSFGPEAQRQLQGDQKLSNGARNGRLMARVENGDDCSSGSSVTTCNNHSLDESRAQSCRVVEPQMNNNNNMNGYACIPGVPWPYTWNPAMPPPGFYPAPAYPMPFYPYWTVPVLSAPARKEKETEQKQGKGCVLVPKTLRIDDPEEAAKSSIWITLGIKNEGMFKGFNKDNNNEKADNSTLLSANPAALSRSNNFHERI